MSDIDRELRVNERIRIASVRVIDEADEQLGVMVTRDALALAKERGLDLVEVAPTASPPVCRFMDYGQFKYEQSRKDRAARRNATTAEVKEIRLTIKTGKGDVDTKVRQMLVFLDHGERVKVSIRFRGREITHADLGRKLLEPFITAGSAEGVGTIDRNPLLDGKMLSIVVSPVKKRHESGKPDSNTPASASPESGKLQAAAPEAPSAPRPAPLVVAPSAPA